MTHSAQRDKLRIVMLLSNFIPRPLGGAENQCLRLSEHLILSGIEVMIVTEGASDLTKKEVIGDLKVYRAYSPINFILLNATRFLRLLLPRKKSEQKTRKAPSLLPYNPSDYGMQTTNVYMEMAGYTSFFLNALWLLWKKRREFDLIHVHIVPWISFVGCLIGKILHKPVLVKESTTTGIDKYSDLPFGIWMRNFVVKNSWFVAMTNTINSNLVRHGVSEDKIFKIPNGIDINSAKERNQVRKNSGLFVGNLTQGAAKGLDVLLKAWPKIVTQFPDAKLTIAGSGDADAFRKFVESLGISNSVFFAGSVSCLMEYYSSTAVFIIPSRREGMSNALLEAMSFGVPVVATKISGNQDLIEDGFNGLLVDPDNSEQLAEAIKFCFANPSVSETYGWEAKNVVSERCSIPVVAANYIRAYKRCLESEQ